MNDRKLERLFERYRKRGDAGALGQVFDASAPELHRLAVHLVRSPAEADDLLQATYLTAMEKAERYEPRRRLMPWLIGILVHHAHELRRRRVGADEGQPLGQVPQAGGDPSEQAQAGEFSLELERALEHLEPLYRAVVIPFLKEGKRAVDIAGETGRPPGTVRMQIHRGLAQLRRALPAGFALGAAVTAVGGIGLGAVREELMRRAVLSGASTTGAATGALTVSSTAWLGGFAMKKLALAAAVAVIALGLGWMIVAGDPPRSEARPAELAEADARPLPELSAQAPVAPANPAASRQAPRETVPDQPSAAANATYTSALAAASGRLVSHDGVPLPGVPLTLFEVRPDLGNRPLSDVFDAPGRAPALELETVRTDDEGRFRFAGAHAKAIHGLGIDLGGPRSSLMMLSWALESGGESDLGDVALTPRGTLRGTVVDAAGRPLAGARVRAGNVAERLRELAPEDLRRDSRIATVGPAGIEVLELPAWVMTYADRLPLSTGLSGADGSFVIEGVPTGVLAVYYDHPDHGQMRLDGPAFVKAGESADAGVLAFESSRSVTCRVVGADGLPIEGAQVLLGTLVTRMHGFLRPARAAAEAGEFRLDGLSAGREVVAAVRRSPGEAWTTARAAASEEHVQVQLAALGELWIALRDASGKPLTGVELRLTSHSMLPALVRGYLDYTPVAVEQQSGRAVLKDLPYGGYTLVGRIDGHAVASTGVVVGRAVTETELVFAPARGVEVRVVEAGSAEPLAGARVSLHEVGGFGALERRDTDAQGLARLREVPTEGGPFELRVAHPAFAIASGIPLPLEGQTAWVELDRGGGLSVQLTVGGELPPEPYVLVIGAREMGFPDEDFAHFARFDELGRARLGQMTPGAYSLNLSPAAAFSDLTRLLGGEESLHMIKESDFTIETGRTTELEVDVLAGPTPGGPNGNLSGTVTLDGAPAARVNVALMRRQGKGIYPVDDTRTDARGRFDFGDVDAGEVSISVYSYEEQGDTVLQRSMGSRTFELVAGEQRRVDLDFVSLSAVVDVRTTDGAAVPETTVILTLEGGVDLFGNGYVGQTGADGRVDVAVFQDGTYTIEARHPELGIGRGRATIEAPGLALPVEIVIEPGVPCRGRVELMVELPPSEMDHQWMIVRSEDSSLQHNTELDLEGEAGFQLVGLTPGEYEAYLVCGTSVFGPVPLELGPAGDEHLLLVFEKKLTNTGR